MEKFKEGVSGLLSILFIMFIWALFFEPTVNKTAMATLYPRWGQVMESPEIVINNTHIRYKNMTDQQMAALQGFMIDWSLTEEGESERVIFINRVENRIEWRSPLRQGFIVDASVQASFKLLASQLTEHVFGGIEVEIHLCDDNFDTKYLILK